VQGVDPLSARREVLGDSPQGAFPRRCAISVRMACWDSFLLPRWGRGQKAVGRPRARTGWDEQDLL